MSSAALRPLYSLSRLLGTPLKKFLEILGGIFPIFRVPPPGRVSMLTLDEIRAVLKDTSSLHGLDNEQQEMMRRVSLMHQISVGQIMTPWKDVDLLLIDEAMLGQSNLERFLDRIIESGRTRLPVVRKNKKEGHGPLVLGYIYVKDILQLIAQNQRITLSVITKWIRPLPSVSVEMQVNVLLNQFRYGAPIACARDKFNFPLGIVTLEDALEEFTGEILDEYDIQEKEI